MTEIEKVRKRVNPGRWQKGFSLGAALLLVSLAYVGATMPDNVPGAIACVWLSVITYLGAYNFSDRQLSKELVHEMDALRQELEQLKKSP